MTHVDVWPDGHPGTKGRLRVAGRIHSCALGRSGIVMVKREGDGGTPVGTFPIRRIHFRPDRVTRPSSRLPVRALRPDDGWCDDTGHPAYNRLIARPFPVSHEVMWRDDRLYDVVLELGYNDAPPRPGLGSAIFLHIAKPSYPPTEGCVAVSPATMRELLRSIRPGSMVRVGRSPSE